MTIWVTSLVSVGVVSLVSLVGLVTLSLDEARTRRLAALLVSFAVGALLGDAFIHLIPQAFKQDAVTLWPSLLILGGMLLFFVGREAVAPRARPAAPVPPSGGRARVRSWPP